MYLTEEEINSIISTPFFTAPVTESVMNYAFYRGRMNATVYTLRFNLTPTYSENYLIKFVLDHLLKHFPLNNRVLGSIHYDLLLCNSNIDPKSYYLWRANSNQAHFDTEEETMFTLTYDTVYRFIRKALQVHVPSLNIYFSSSNVVIERALAVVFSFVKI